MENWESSELFKGYSVAWGYAREELAAVALDKDFEDCLQLAVAVRNGCRQFITFDQKLYKKYHKRVAPLTITASTVRLQGKG